MLGGVLYEVDKIWVEYSGRLIMLNYIIIYSKFKFINYKIYMFINFIVGFIIIIYIFIYLNSLKNKV